MVAKKPAKKVVKKVVKAPAKKRTASKATKASTAELKSFKLYRDTNFFEFKVSRQTLYWTILVAFVIIMQLWILQTQLEVMQATDNLNNLINQ